MSRDAAFEARLDWRTPAAIGGAVVLTTLAWLLGPWGEALARLWGWPAMIGVIGLVSAGFALRDRAPRVIVAGDGIRWREARKDPFNFLPWDRILDARILQPDEDGKFLRLTLPTPPVLQQLASDRTGPYEVDIPISDLDCSEHALRAAIRRRSPRLFARAPRSD